MRKYGFVWKVRYWWKKGIYPSRGSIRFWMWLDRHPEKKSNVLYGRGVE